MRILAWNVNHRAARRPIPSWLIQAIGAESPDVVSLTEYVIGADHDRFLGELASVGLRHCALTVRVNGSNQVLLAAREPLQLGDVTGSSLHESILPNFLHVHMIESGVELLGFRMPAYEGTDRPMKRRTWEWLIDALKTLRDRPAIIIGDFNTAFGDSVSRCGDCLDALTESGWRPAVPADGFSWRGRTNGTERRIDLAFLSPSATARSVSYSWSFRDIGEEASAMQIGRPDHAMLLLEAETTTA